MESKPNVKSKKRTLDQIMAHELAGQARSASDWYTLFTEECK